MPKIFHQKFNLQTRDSPHVKNKVFRKFPARNIFVRECDDENISHEFFGIEINANENKANYGKHNFLSLIYTVIYCIYCNTTECDMYCNRYCSYYN